MLIVMQAGKQNTIERPGDLLHVRLVNIYVIVKLIRWPEQ